MVKLISAGVSYFQPFSRPSGRAWQARKYSVRREARAAAFSRRDASEFCKSFRPKIEGACDPQKREGAGKTGCALHPRSRVPMHMQRKLHTSIQVQRKQSGLPCAMALRLIFVLSPVRPEL